MEQRLQPRQEQLASFNTWLRQRIAVGAGSVRAVILPPDPHGHAIAAARHLARCGTRALRLRDASPGLLEAACTIDSLTGLALSIADPQCSLDSLGTLLQLQSLEVSFIPDQDGAAAPTLRLELPAVTQLLLWGMAPCTVSLDGCSALQQVKVSEACGLALVATRPLPQLTRLELWWPRDLAVPWQQLRALRELVLLDENEAGLLEGAAHLTSLRSLHLDCVHDFVLPPGAWLAGVTRLVLEAFNDGEVSGIVSAVWPGLGHMHLARAPLACGKQADYLPRRPGCAAAARCCWRPEPVAATGSHASLV